MTCEVEQMHDASFMMGEKSLETKPQTLNLVIQATINFQDVYDWVDKLKRI